MTNDQLDTLSRPIATADFLGTEATDSKSFFGKSVLLTGEKEILATANGVDSFSAALLLLLRMTTKLTVDVSQHPAPQSVRDMIEEFEIYDILVADSMPSHREFDSILNIGTKTEEDVPLVAVNSNGWLVRVTSAGVEISNECSTPNPIAAVAAACIGVSEVFKMLVGLKKGRGESLRGYEYSLWDYERSASEGPRLPETLHAGSTLLVGAGAIGNGVVYILRKLDWKGTLYIVDEQQFKKENLGTCILLSARDIGKAKADVLSFGIANARAFECSIDSFKQELGKSIMDIPDVVLTGLDNIDARREVQQIWPRLVIDGAIGPVSCEVTLHPWGPNLSCLLCDFEQPTRSAFATQSALTGISEERIKDPSAVIHESDVENAPPAQREWLRSRVGQEVCSVVSEAELANLAAERHDKKFRPSVPFVACLSSAMMLTELVRHLTNAPSALTTGFQFDVLVGPHNGIKKDHERKSSCLCVTRKAIIDRIRQDRFGQSAA